MGSTDCPNIEDVTRRYLALTPYKELAADYGVKVGTVQKWLREAGTPLRGNQPVIEATRKQIDAPTIVARYQAGESELALSKEYGVSRPVIRRRLLDAGVTPRDRSGGMYARMARATSEQRRQWASASHDASRGRPQTEDQRCLVAESVEKTQANRSPVEDALCAMLADRGVRYATTKAVGRFNVDVALYGGSLAVDLFGGHWHNSGRHAARYRRRCDYLLERGWLPVIVWVTKVRPLSDSAVDKIAEINCHREWLDHPQATTEVVMWGTGEIIPEGGYDPQTGYPITPR